MSQLLTELDNYLQVDHNPDAWSDFSFERAVQLLDSLDNQDWEMIKQIWYERSPDWQGRLADALFSCNNIRAITLLEDLLQSNDLEVLEQVLESLEGRDDVYQPSESVKPRLREIERLFKDDYHTDLIEKILSRKQPSSE
jgi:hypothetical protein